MKFGNTSQFLNLNLNLHGLMKTKTNKVERKRIKARKDALAKYEALKELMAEMIKRAKEKRL